MAKRVYESRIADNVNNFANEEIIKEEIKPDQSNNIENTKVTSVKIPEDFTLSVAKKQTKILRSFNLEIEVYERLLKFIDDNQLKINGYINALISNDLRNRGY